MPYARLGKDAAMMKAAGFNLVRLGEHTLTLPENGLERHWNVGQTDVGLNLTDAPLVLNVTPGLFRGACLPAVSDDLPADRGARAVRQRPSAVNAISVHPPLRTANR